MTRLASIVLVLLALGACDKPTPEDCRKALLNMQHLLGTENLNTNATLEGEVRRCRGGSKRKAVECAIKATTLDELRACDFEKVPGKVTLPPSTPAGSAAMAPAGSAAPAVPAAPVASSPDTPAAPPAGSASGSAK